MDNIIENKIMSRIFNVMTSHTRFGKLTRTGSLIISGVYYRPLEKTEDIRRFTMKLKPRGLEWSGIAEGRKFSDYSKLLDLTHDKTGDYLYALMDSFALQKDQPKIEDFLSKE